MKSVPNARKKAKVRAQKKEVIVELAEYVGVPSVPVKIVLATMGRPVRTYAVNVTTKTT